MKLKGISRAEQFVDKIVFAVFALFLVFVLVMQVGLLGGTPAVKIAGKDVPLDQADGALKTLADVKRSRMESDRVDDRIPASLPSALEKYRQSMAARSAGEPTRLAGRLGLPVLKGDDALAADTLPGAVSAGDTDFEPVIPPAPSRPLLALFEGTIDPISVAQIGPDLAQLLPAQQPYDLHTVTILSFFDASQLRAILGGGSGQPPIPIAFWQGRVELFDVRVVRQERGSDGQWGGEVVLPPIPGRFSMRQTLARDDLTPLNLRGLLDDERSNRGAIRRPRFYHAISGEHWTWPALPDAGADPARQARINRLQRGLQGVRGEIARLEQLLNPPTTPPPGSPPRNPPGDRGSRGHPGDLPSAPFALNDPTPTDPGFRWPEVPLTWRAQGPPGGGRPPTPPPPPRPDPKVVWAKQLAELRKTEAEILKELQELGVSASGETTAPQAAEFDEPLGSLTDSATERVTLWTHDLGAKPGAVYRYRARVVVTNPFFGQGDRLKDSLRSLAAPVVAVGAESPWSDPISVPPATLAFLRSASEAGQDPIANQSRASIDLYKFYYGYWRRASAALTPGDAVAAETEELPALVTWRIEKSAEGKWIVGAETPAERRLRLSTGAVLLDVLAAPVAGDRAGSSALLADSAGLVFSMNPGATPALASSRARVEASAAASRKAAVRLPEGEPANPEGPPSDPGAPPPPPTPPSNPGGDGDSSRD